MVLVLYDPNALDNLWLWKGQAKPLPEALGNVVVRKMMWKICRGLKIEPRVLIQKKKQNELVTT